MPRSYVLATALVFGCATTKPDGPRRKFNELLQQRTEISDAIHIATDDAARTQVHTRVDKLLAGELTVDKALRIALLNNRGLQATLEQLGIAQADLVQAGLLQNPVIAGDLVNSTKGNGLGGGLALSTSLLSAFLIPAKRKLAKAELQHAIVSVAQEALTLARDVRVAYANVQAAVASLELHRTLTQVAEVADELASRQAEAGNIGELDRQRFAAALDEARLELTDYQVALVEAREQLNRLLGLWGRQLNWSASPLSVPPQIALDLTLLEPEGMAQRLDVSAARAQRDAMLLALKLRRRGLVPQVEIGVEARNEVGNDTGHEWVIGPSLAIEIPVFDPGHADLAKLRAQLRQTQHLLAQTAINARSEIRLERERVIAAQRKLAYFDQTVLTRHELMYQRALERYNGMLIGTYELLETRAAQVEAQHDRIEALRDYWVSWADLELATGGRLPQPDAAASSSSQRR